MSYSLSYAPSHTNNNVNVLCPPPPPPPPTPSGPQYEIVQGCTVEPQIKDTIEITSEQRTSFNVPNGDFPGKILPIPGLAELTR